MVQIYEAVSPHPKLREHRLRYLWLNEIYEIYMEEFKRLDFDAELYAAKTRKLIQESSRLLNFKGHLPEITVDEKYIENLNRSKLDPSDKAEKIIRDIETVIRRNELDSPIYVDFQNRLEELMRQKEAHSKGIEVLLKELEGLYCELDDVASLPHRMGFEDRGSFDVFTEIKNKKGADLDTDLSRDFAKAVADRIKSKIYIGWQESDREKKRMQTEVELIALSEEYESLDISDDDELMERIMNRIVQHYSLD